jgi:uncharacterized membrane protein
MLPAELKTILIAMSPIVELRGSIPIALKIYNLPVWSALFFSVLGDLVPTFFILLFLEPFSSYLGRKSALFKRFFDWLFRKTRKKHEAKFEKWEKFALTALVAVPLPFTGAWTGAVCAFLFGIPFKQAFFLIALGVLIAGIIVTLISLGIFGFLDFLTVSSF